MTVIHHVSRKHQNDEIISVFDRIKLSEDNLHRIFEGLINNKIYETFLYLNITCHTVHSVLDVLFTCKFISYKTRGLVYEIYRDPITRFTFCKIQLNIIRNYKRTD